MSIRFLKYFEYLERTSPLHSVDPRSKSLFILSMTCLVIYISDLIPLAIILGLIIPLIFLGKFMKKWLYSLLFFIPLLLLIIILNALYLQVEHPTTVAITIAIRLIILSALFGLFFQTVSPDDIAQMYIKLKFPYSFAWTISTAYRFIPTLSKETTIIIDAQKSRGLQIDRGRIFKRIKNMVPLLIPIFASALRRSWQLAEAVESRGWNATKKRTFLYSLELKWWDYLIMLFSLGIFGIFLWMIITQFVFPSYLIYNIPEQFELKEIFRIIWIWIKGLFS